MFKFRLPSLPYRTAKNHPAYRAAWIGRLLAVFAGSFVSPVWPLMKTALSPYLNLERLHQGSFTLYTRHFLAEIRPGESAMALMERADAALYVSKRTGRNRVSTATDVADAA